MNRDDDWIDVPYDPQSRYDDLAKFEPEFWKKKKLEDLSKDEWELLCDGCGKCCLNKMQIRKDVKFTNTVCRFLNCDSCLCKIYYNRFEKVPDCRDITLEAVREKPRWLPKTCAYWLLDNGFDLPDWHPLITGKANSVHEAKMSLQGRDVVSESGVDDYENYLVDWSDL
ncbi:MAG: YcgN family cysteine cluster protein [Alphaproteobacteria bacterium]|nr:YcgN family cysteine cluster protein [Alphaproteobacteria bacterium]